MFACVTTLFPQNRSLGVTFKSREDHSIGLSDNDFIFSNSVIGLVVEYVVAIDVTRVRFPADALFSIDFMAIWETRSLEVAHAQRASQMGSNSSII